MAREAVARPSPSPGELSIAVERTDRNLRLTARGEVDLASAPELEAHLRSVERADADWVVVDLSGVEFMDSSGLHVLLAARKRLAEQGRTLSISGVRAQVRRLMELSGTMRLFPVTDVSGTAAGRTGPPHAA
jgi:anti-sigma B factor antagonist